MQPLTSTTTLKERRKPLLRLILSLLALSLVGCDREAPPADAGPDGDLQDAADADTDTDEDAGGGDAEAEGDADDDGDEPLVPSWDLRLWAPGVDSVEVVVETDGWTPHPLEGDGSGSWRRTLELDAEGARYHYVIERGEQRFSRLDPRALAVSRDWANSILHRRAFDWAPTEASFRRPGLRDAVIYELHVGSFTSSGGGNGTFLSAIERLDHLAALGVNVIELMPIAEFRGESAWGYNGSFFSALESAYGAPEDLRRFVEEAHARGIAVILDLVVNHLGDETPLCDFLALNDGACGEPWFYGDDRGRTDWGPRPSFDSDEVRGHLLEAVDLWMSAYHLDGFRWDSTSNIRFSSFGEGEPLLGGQELLRASSRRIRAQGENMLNIAEDFHGGDEITGSLEEGGYGFDAQWEGGLHWNLRRALVEGIVDLPSLIGSLEGSFNGDPFQRVLYTESHDTTGLFNGNVRLPEEISPSDPTGWLARKGSTLAAAVLLTTPGVPMLLMGQEMLQRGTFHDDRQLDWTGLDAFPGIVSLYRDLIALRRDLSNVTAGLRGPNIAVTHRNDGARVLIYRRWDRGGAGDDVIVVVNLGATSFAEYILGFPAPGSWRVRFDSDSSRYSPDFTDQSVLEATTAPSPRDGFDQSAAIAIGPYSVVALSQDP